MRSLFQSFITVGALAVFLLLFQGNIVYPTKKGILDQTVWYPIKPGCFRTRVDGTGNVHIRYCYSSDKKTLLDTGIKILVACWDKEGVIIPQDISPAFGNPDKLNEALRPSFDW